MKMHNSDFFAEGKVFVFSTLDCFKLLNARVECIVTDQKTVERKK